MAHDDLRSYLRALHSAGELVTIGREVDPAYELAAVIRVLRDKPVLFMKVKGSKFPVVANVFGNYHTMEIALECSRDDLLPQYLERTKQPVPPKVVSSGPCQEIVYTGDEVNLFDLPLPTLNELDGGAYIDAGIIIGNDPEFGYNLSLQRIQLKDRNRAGIWIAPMMHVEAYRQRAEELGKPLEIAVAIGCDPSLYIGSQVYAAIDVDEYAVAGGMRNKPVELVRAKTVDLLVPATAEIVLEGRILPNVREPEGPFGEFTGYYGTRGDRPVIEFSAMTMRKNAIFQAIYLRKPPTEGVYLSAIPKAAELLSLLKRVVPEVRGVYLTPGGCGKFHCVIGMRKRHEGEGKQALLAVLASHMAVKHAIVVDEDIDIYDHDDVEWAVATRSQFDLDSVVITGVPHNLDPSASKHTNNLITKVGVDATLPMGGGKFSKTVDVHPEYLKRVRDEWSTYQQGVDCSTLIA